MNAFLAKLHSLFRPAKGKKKMKISPLGIAVALACVVLFFALLFLVFQKKPVEPLPPAPAEKTFMEKYSDFSGTWKNNGIVAERLHEALPELVKKDNAALGLISAGLEKEKSSGNESIALLAGAYTDLVQFAIAKKEHSAALAKVGTLHEKETCETYREYGRLSDAAEKMLLLAKDYYEKTGAFVKKFPEEARQVSLEAEEFDWKPVEGQAARLESSVEYFKGKCNK
jgi:hypothetical protein